MLSGRGLCFPRGPAECAVSECDRGASTMTSPGPTGVSRYGEKKRINNNPGLIAVLRRSSSHSYLTGLDSQSKRQISQCQTLISRHSVHFIASLSTAAVTEYLATARVLNHEVTVISNIRDILHIGQLFLTLRLLLSYIYIWSVYS